MAPIRAILSGAQLVIVGAILNKNMYSFVTRSNIQKPADLKGKVIGVASFGAANEFSALMALKALGIPPQEVNFRVAGGTASPVSRRSSTAASTPPSCRTATTPWRRRKGCGFLPISPSW